MRELAAIMTMVLLVAGCGGGAADAPASEAAAPATEVAESEAAESEPAESEAAATEVADACATDQLPVVQPGQLTIATDTPAFPPWFVDDDPTNGEGFESAVAYAVAEELGFGEDEVEWIVVPFNASYAPGPKDFDFDINQISITPRREEAVDFSRGYYDVNQALVALEDSPLSEAGGLDALTDSVFGAQIGTTSLDFIEEVIQPEAQPFVYDTTNDAKSALENGQIDGIVLDLPTAFFVTAVEIPGSVVVGQFEPTGSPEQFGLLFEDGSALVDCVDQALERLEESGTLDDIQQRWLSDVTDAPVLN